MTRVRSVSGVGLSIVYVEFDWGTDIYRNRQLVAERLALVREQLPPNTVAADGADQLDHGADRAGRADRRRGVSPMEVREVADFSIRPRLLTIPGVAQVIPIGGEVRQYRVAPHPPALRALGVTYEQVEKALAQFGVNTGGGFTDQHSREYLIRNIGRTTSLDDLRSIVVAKVERRAGLSAPGRRRRIRRQGEARRRRLHGQARRHRLGREAAQRRHGRADARDRAGAEGDHGDAAAGHQGRPDPVPPGRTSSRPRSATSRRVLLEAGARRRRRAVRVPAELAHHGDLADRDPGLDPGHGDRSSTSPGCRSTR